MIALVAEYLNYSSGPPILEGRRTNRDLGYLSGQLAAQRAFRLDDAQADVTGARWRLYGQVNVSASTRALDARKAGVYSFSVRRIWATLLVAVFSFALIGPATFVPKGDQKLPPCCRKTGKHHCALAQNHESTSGPSFQSGRCTFFPNEQTLPPIPTDGMVKVGQVILALVFSHPTPRPRTEKLGGILFDRTGQKRGPPSIS